MAPTEVQHFNGRLSLFSFPIIGTNKSIFTIRAPITRSLKAAVVSSLKLMGKALYDLWFHGA